MKKILYLFDDINYPSGAQKVTFFQMKTLSNYYKVHAFSLSRPKEHMDLQNVVVIGEEIWEKTELFSYSLKKVLSLKEISFLKKIQRILYSVLRVGERNQYLKHLFYREMKQKFEKYDVIIVVSEASKLRELVTDLKHPKKIQWIHTDYALWSDFSDWTRMVTRKDAEIYCKFDKIVTLSECSRKGLLKKLPHLKNKTIVIPNLIDGETILRKSEEIFDLQWNPSKYHIITIGRIDKEKAYDRVLDICKRLKEKGISFCWYIVGDGPLKEYIQKRIKIEQLTEQVKLMGRMENPYSLMKRCDWFVLLSKYEGTPVTIDEAMVLGIPVIATDVGGIAEQITRGNSEYLLIKSKRNKGVSRTIDHLEKVEKQLDYKIWNESILHQIRNILD